MLKQLKVVSDFVFKPLVVKHLPLHLQLEITDACNQRCIMCTRDRLVENPQIMSFEAFKKVYDQIRPEKLNISGLGEPFINKDILKISSYASRNGSAVNLATNFTLAGKYVDEIIESGIDQLKVSIDAATRETYLKIRGMNKFEEIVASIRRLNDLKNKVGVTKPDIRFNFALQKDNIDELNDVVNLAYDLNIDSIYVQYLEYIDMADRKADIADGLDVQTLKRRLTDMQREMSRKKINSNLHIWLKDLDLYANKIGADENFKPDERTCLFPWFSTFIEVNGDVKPCPIFVWKRNEGRMGNVFEDDFIDIWNNESYRELRRAFKGHHRPFAPCRTCIPQRVSSLFYMSSKMLPKR